MFFYEYCIPHARVAGFDFSSRVWVVYVRSRGKLGLEVSGSFVVLTLIHPDCTPSRVVLQPKAKVNLHVIGS